MYRRIEELAEGKVYTDVPVLTITPDQIRLEPVEGVSTSGTFMIESIRHVPMKGVIYSTDLRMEIKNPQFQGERAEISYEFHGEHMQEGEVATGTFFVISNGGEYDLSWSVAVKRLYAETSIGRITNLDDFVRLYRTNWRESIHVFSAPGFRKLLRSTSEQLYDRLLAAKPVTRTNIEQFLVACGRKNRVLITLPSHEAEHLQVSEPLEEVLQIRRGDWGYVELTVSSDADFLVPEKERITSDDFNGDHMEFRYRIYPELMHAGKNYARLTFKNPMQRELYEITAVKQAVLDLERDDRRRIRQENLQLYRNYERYLDGSIVLGEWAKRTTERLKRRRDREEHTDMDALWCAYAYLCNRQLQEAAWIMDEYRHSRSAGTDREWAFFLYLCTLTEKEPKLLEKLHENIRAIYREKHTDPWLRFIIMQIADHSPEVSARQLKLMEQWFTGGLCSPFLYALAADIYVKEPYLLLQLGRFELHVLHWICRHQRFTEDLCRQIVRRAIGVHTYKRLLDDILQACYEAYPQEEMLAGVCAYRIKGQRFDADTHAWYELAIEHDLQITGLYEAFMASLDPREVRQLPKAVQLYFQYTNHLNYRQKAVLYVNIIAHKEDQPMVYERYQQIMLDFAEQEILAGHIDDNLAVVYAHTLERLPMTEALAHALAKILYVNQFTCPEDSYTHVIVQQENLRSPQHVPIVHHQAYVPVYPGNYVILLQDAHGKRYALPPDAQMVRLMNPGRYIRKCLEQAPEELPYVLHHMNGKTKLLHMDERMAGYVRTLVRSEAVSDEYKSRISPGFLDYCRGEGFAGDIRDYLKKIDFGRLARSAKDQYLESLIQLHMYGEAWAFLIMYGIGKVSLDALQEIVLAQLQAQQMQEEEHLLYLTLQCFLQGSRKRPVLEYLCSYYQGPAARMVEIWREAMKQQIRTSELEERLLIQMMFTAAFTPDVQKVFADYAAGHGREQVCMAYLTYFSYEVFVQQTPAEPQMYVYLEQHVLGRRQPNPYVRLALLEHYADQEVLTADQERFVDEQLETFMEQGQIYECFLRMPDRQLVRHHLYDRYVIEYRQSVSDSQVWLNYRMSTGDGSFRKVLMEPAIAGICLWNIPMIGGEQLEYYICEKSDRMETITESHVVELPHYAAVPKNSHARLSQMVGSVQADEAAQLQTQMEEYQVYDSLTEKLFRVR